MNGDWSHIRVLDPAVLDALRGYAKSAAFLKQVIEIFEEHGQTSIAELCAAAQADDRESLRRVAHRLKGSCLNVGAQRMAQMLRSFEVLTGENASGDDTHVLLASLPDTLEETCKALKSIL